MDDMDVESPSGGTDDVLLPSYLHARPTLVVQLQRSLSAGPASSPSLLWETTHTVVLQWEMFTRVFLPVCKVPVLFPFIMVMSW
jgi:hypothetical protein